MGWQYRGKEKRLGFSAGVRSEMDKIGTTKYDNVLRVMKGKGWLTINQIVAMTGQSRVTTANKCRDLHYRMHKIERRTQLLNNEGEYRYDGDDDV